MKNKVLNITIVGLILLIIVAGYLLFIKNQDVSFVINSASLEIKKGSTAQIDYSISSKRVKITWKSSDTKVATVDENGVVSGQNSGSAIITGTIKNGEKEIKCLVKVVPINYDVILEDATIPNGEVLMSVNKTYELPITYSPSYAYIKSIDYEIENTNIISVDNGVIKALNEGSSLLKININNKIEKEINVNVVKDNVLSQIVEPVKEVTFSKEEVVVNVGEEKKIEYTISPNNGNIYKKEWKVLKDDLAIVNENDLIKGLKVGESEVVLVINNRIEKKIKIKVVSPIESITLNYSPKSILKIGDTVTLYPTVLPNNAYNKKIIYESSNPGVLSVSQNGVVMANALGMATIKIMSEDKTKSLFVNFTILPKTSVMNTTEYIWGFNKETDVIPKRADTNFFNNFVMKGKGSLNGNIFTYLNYAYDLSRSVLTINNKDHILVRIYYPEGKDLSKLNTFTFIGGSGEANFNSYFNIIDKDPSILKSSGIIILITDGTYSYNKNTVIEATNFVRQLIDQNKNARNTVGGYSKGGPTAADAIEIGNYDKLMLVNTAFNDVANKKNLANKEIIFYTARYDTYSGTYNCINNIAKNNYRNVTLITNNSDYIKWYGDKFLIINPGNTMHDGHTYNNITDSHYFSYGCD